MLPESGVWGNTVDALTPALSRRERGLEGCVGNDGGYGVGLHFVQDFYTAHGANRQTFAKYCPIPSLRR